MYQFLAVMFTIYYLIYLKTYIYLCLKYQLAFHIYEMQTSLGIFLIASPAYLFSWPLATLPSLCKVVTIPSFLQFLEHAEVLGHLYVLVFNFESFPSTLLMVCTFLVFRELSNLLIHWVCFLYWYFVVTFISSSLKCKP